jgi:hypothetical protein
MKKLIIRLLPIADWIFLPFVCVAAWLMKIVRRAGVKNLPNCRNALIKIGIFPVADHYYEPQFDHRCPRSDFSQDRALPGIDWNVDGQLTTVERLSFSEELANTPIVKTGDLQFYLNNGSFESGDAEFWYQVIRAYKPKRIFEIGSGNSTLMAIRAIAKNREHDPAYSCEHVCVEPFEMPWLEESGVSVIRSKVETLEPSYFSRLQENDVLFIDSSHIIRPQGDVLFEYLELLPSLNKGVIVHIHDIFSPKNYPKEWLQDQVRFWNEQYLLEAFLSHNKDWEILAALNFLHHNHFEKLQSVAPFLTPEREPGSFYMIKTA